MSQGGVFVAMMPKQYGIGSVRLPPKSQKRRPHRRAPRKAKHQDAEEGLGSGRPATAAAAASACAGAAAHPAPIVAASGRRAVGNHAVYKIRDAIGQKAP